MVPQLLLASKRRSLPLLTAFAVALFAALGAHLAATYDARETRAHAESDLADVARLQAEMTRGFIDRIAQSLKLIGYVREREGPDFDVGKLIQEGRLDGAGVLQFGFADHEGIVRQANLAAGSAPVSIADRAHFLAVARDGERFHIGRPVFGRLSEHWMLQFAAPVRNASGAFLGSAMASVEPAVLGAALVAPQKDAVVALVGGDGVVRAWSLSEPAHLASPMAAGPLMARLLAAPSGVWQGPAPWTQGPHVTFWRKLDAYPLYVTLTVPVETLTADAGTRARFYWAAALLLALAAFLVAIVDVKRRARAEAALEAAHAADAQKTRLLASLGSELRHPVDMLRWSIDALADPADESARKRALSDLRRADAALGRAINDAAELARLMRESKELDLGVVDARLFARGAFEVARARAGGAGIVCDFALDLPEGLRILADEIRLRRVADALLAAALDRAGRGGRVGFSVGARGLDQRNVEIAIAVTASGEASGAPARENGVVAALAQGMGGKIERLTAPGGTLDVFKAGFARAA